MTVNFEAALIGVSRGMFVHTIRVKKYREKKINAHNALCVLDTFIRCI